MSLLNNRLVLGIIRLLFYGCTRVDYLNLGVTRRREPFMLACTHLSHYDPFCLSVVIPRKVDWMARAEFYDEGLSRWFMQVTDAFSINRDGPALPGIRTALRRIEAGRLVGIFPEGEVTRGRDSALRGGVMKQGVGLIARRAEIPVVPCVIIGSHQFSRVVPWLPLRSGRLCVAFGEPILPDLSIPPGRASRRELTERLERGFQTLFARALREFGLADSQVL